MLFLLGLAAAQGRNFAAQVRDHGAQGLLAGRALGDDAGGLGQLFGLGLELLGLTAQKLLLRGFGHDDARLDQRVIIFLAGGVDAVVISLQLVVGFAGHAHGLRPVGQLEKYLAVLHVSQECLGLAGSGTRGRGEKGIWLNVGL